MLWEIEKYCRFRCCYYHSTKLSALSCAWKSNAWLTGKERAFLSIGDKLVFFAKRHDVEIKRPNSAESVLALSIQTTEYNTHFEYDGSKHIFLLYLTVVDKSQTYTPILYCKIPI